MRKTALFIKIITVVFIVTMIFTSCARKDKDFSGDNSYATSSVAPVQSAAPDKSSLPSSAEKPADATSTGIADATESVVPTPIVTSTPEGIHTEVAESFFNGTWASTSGMLYIFDGEKGAITLKDISTEEILLEGSYKSSTEDFNEYRLSMTFHNETDSFIAWKYADSGSVRLIVEETGALYDLLHRIEG